MHCLRNRQDTCGQRCVGKGGWKSFFPASPVVVGNTAAQTVFGHWLIRIGWKRAVHSLFPRGMSDTLAGWRPYRSKGVVAEDGRS